MKVTELKKALKAKVMNDLPIMFSMLQKFLLLVTITLFSQTILTW